MIIQIEPWIDNSELDELKKVIDSTYVVEHKLTKEFETRTKELTGAKHAIAITNGTMALFCCLKALGVGRGDKVIVPNITFVATANAVILAGGTPVFCEIDEDTFCIDPQRLEDLLKTDTYKAVMPVHLYGQAADMDAILKLKEKYNFKLIEDAAQGVGVSFNGKHTGTFSDCGILSYYGNKTITCGEGGIILTNNDEIARDCYRLKNHGRDQKGTFIHEHIGFNFSFTEMQAAIGIAQMKKLPKIISKKAEIEAKYREAFKDHPNIKNVFIDERSTPVFWFTSILVDHATELEKYLKENQVISRRFFYPLHMQPCYKDLDIQGDFSVSERVYSKGLSLPSSVHLTDEEQNTVISLILKFYENRD